MKQLEKNFKNLEESEINSLLNEYILSLTRSEKILLLERFQANKFTIKRKFLRKEKPLEVNYVTKEGKIHKGVSKDISSGGIFIETKELFAIGDSLKMVVSVSNSERPLKLTGKIVRIDKEGIGIEFNLKTQYFQDIMEDKLESIG